MCNNLSVCSVCSNLKRYVLRSWAKACSNDLILTHLVCIVASYTHILSFSLSTYLRYQFILYGTSSYIHSVFLYVVCFSLQSFMCCSLHLKQSSIPVFFLTTNCCPDFDVAVDPRSKTIHSAVTHAKMQDFMVGVICYSLDVGGAEC